MVEVVVQPTIVESPAPPSVVAVNNRQPKRGREEIEQEARQKGARGS
jgi:hypothetical protein